MNSSYKFLLIFSLFFLSSHSVFISTATAAANSCRSHFIQIDVLNSFTHDEKNKLETAASSLAKLLGKKDDADLQAKLSLDASIKSFIARKKMLAQQVTAFKKWFADRVQFYIHLEKEDLKNIFFAQMLREKNLNEQKFRQKILIKLFQKYETRDLSIALKSAFHSDLATNPTKADDIFFISKLYHELEFTHEIFNILVHYGCPAAVEYFISNGAELHFRGKDDKTPLHLAAQYNRSSEVMQLLIQADRGANLNARTRSNDKPLHFAVLNPNIEVLKVLIAAGADRTLKDGEGRSLLHIASSTPGIDISRLQFLIDLDARKNINEQTFEGKTALHFAVESKDVNILETLLIAGADPLISTTSNSTPLHTALATDTSVEMIQLLITANPIQLSLKDVQGYTPLHRAARHHPSVEVIPLLVQADGGAQLNSKTYLVPNEHLTLQYTPLHLAIYNSAHSTGMIQALLDAGADPTVQNNLYETPYHLSLDSHKKEILLQATEKWKKNHP